MILCNSCLYQFDKRHCNVPDFNNKTTYKYVIQYNGIENKHTHYSVDYDVCLNRCCVYFKNQEDAQAVIDNPNFRDILDTIYKD